MWWFLSLQERALTILNLILNRIKLIFPLLSLNVKKKKQSPKSSKPYFLNYLWHNVATLWHNKHRAAMYTSRDVIYQNDKRANIFFPASASLRNVYTTRIFEYPVVKTRVVISELHLPAQLCYICYLFKILTFSQAYAHFTEASEIFFFFICAHAQ